MATGAYVRIKREGEWVNIEFDELTQEEISGFAAREADPWKKAEEGWKWAKFLAKWIKENVREA